jgi:hypothetical protein
MFHPSERERCKTEGMVSRWDELHKVTEDDNKLVDHL